jgi:hypothetical protein
MEFCYWWLDSGTLTIATKVVFFHGLKMNPLFGGHPIPVWFYFGWIDCFKHEKYFEQKYFKITFNQNFRDVISNCQNIKREGQNGTWITNDMIEAYWTSPIRHSKIIEVWQNDILVGGLWHWFGSCILYTKVSNASKVAYCFGKPKKKENYKLWIAKFIIHI